MTLQTIKLAGKAYVRVPEKDFRHAMGRLASLEKEQDQDAAIVRRRLKSKGKLIALSTIRAELGL